MTQLEKKALVERAERIIQLGLTALVVYALVETFLVLVS